MRSVLISGAGIAGATMAYWLARKGFAVTVVERTSSVRARLGGHAVDLFGPAVDVVERMGLLPEIEAESTRNELISLVKPDGSLLDIPVDDVASTISGRHVEILRGVLTQLLYRTAENEAEFVFGDMITRLDDQPDGVEVEFEHGRPRRFDLVIGADGLHSGVRRLAFGEESALTRYTGAWLGVYSMPDVLRIQGRTLLHLTPGRLIATYPVHQTGEARVLLLERSEQEPPGIRAGAEAQRALLRERFATAGWQVPTLLDHLESADDLYVDSITQVTLDQWAKGRVALVGDAGYAPGPAVGGGTSLAMIGGYVLAGELGRTDDHDQAFAAYRAEIGEFVRRSSRIAPAMVAQSVPLTPLGVRAMALALRFYPRLPHRLRSWIAARRPGPANALAAMAMREY
ncbi:FAD-dependent monooxygenase [Microlunatus parietis]|uniref:2-polyprenyl-6-methoxyphenol hydroxylase-like FAD-dependent oxidoreductase n=1 Tax=Microlunatus parietis TaxID=682979 RepID=A0A7Y9I5E4_9ACTN|nr:FAD-dependent monooxygenase [Microlunatus parietis]NYE70330.1 2-polyprenyl-6-methoxyphenol hydroxylase-like FAD-dependent oxidoreductase [Microlunatus parietis]